MSSDLYSEIDESDKSSVVTENLSRYFEMLKNWLL